MRRLHLMHKGTRQVGGPPHLPLGLQGGEHLFRHPELDRYRVLALYPPEKLKARGAWRLAGSRPRLGVGEALQPASKAPRRFSAEGPATLDTRLVGDRERGIRAGFLPVP